MLSLALMLEPLPLSLRECYTFALSPTDSADPSSTGALLSFAKAYCRRCATGSGSASQDSNQSGESSFMECCTEVCSTDATF